MLSEMGQMKNFTASRIGIPLCVGIYVECVTGRTEYIRMGLPLR